MHLLKAAVAFLLLTILSTVAVAEQQLSRQQYVAMFHDNLLAPCHDAKFVACLDSSEASCVKQVNQLVESCSKELPATINQQNFDAAADGYANCVFTGLQKQFGKTSEEIGSCETRAGLE